MTKKRKLRRQLYDSFKNRALLYWLFYDELRREVGAERAEEILKRGVYRRGTEKGNPYRQYAPGDLEGLRKDFLDGIPDNGRLFEPEVLRSDEQELDIKFHRCPLKEAWIEAGLANEDVATLCRIASRIDYGTFEAAGFGFSADTWQPGGDGCCCLHIRPGVATREPASE